MIEIIKLDYKVIYLTKAIIVLSDIKKIYDISPPLSEKIGVFPGDTPFTSSEVLSFEKGHNLRLSHIKTTVHLGAHTDAPSHYHKDGKTIEAQDLEIYLGECQIVDVSKAKGPRILESDIDDEISSSRVLFKTDSFPDPDSWNSDFFAFDPELIEFLSKKGVRLIGIDTPSVDVESDKSLLTHNQIYKHDMAILEGIVLKEVPVGFYELIALPLPIVGADASPVRAILLEKGNK